MPGTKKSRKRDSSDKKDSSTPQPIADEVQAVRKIFTEAQATVQCHQRCCDSLPRLLSKHESAWEEYLSCLRRILVISKRDVGVERLVQFVILAANSDSYEPLLDRTVKYLLKCVGALDKAVRFRVCQLLGGMATRYTTCSDLDEEDLDLYVDAVLPRLRDKVASVRVQAVGALRPFQFGLEPDDDEEVLKEDRVREELIRVMVSDSSPDARQAALRAVTKTVGMFDKLILRTRDVKDSVRKAAFQTIGHDIASKHLHPRNRVELVKTGFADTSEGVVDACRFMVCGNWFRDANYDLVQLLRRLGVADGEKVPELVAKEVIGLGLRADRERVDPSLGMGLTPQDAKGLRQAAGRHLDLSALSANGGCISAEEALYARVQVDVVKADKDLSAGEKETRLEAILTDTTTLCELIADNSQRLKVLLDADMEDGEDGDADERIFVLEQLLQLAARTDFSEEAGRRRLVTLLQNLLLDVNLTHHFVEPSMGALAAAHTSEADFVRIVAELVSDISDLVSRRTAGDASTQEASLNASFTSMSLVGGAAAAAAAATVGTPGRPSTPMLSAVRAAIPKNFVLDRARAIEGIAPIATMSEEEAQEPVAGSGAAKRVDPVSSEDEFMDALSHHSIDDEESGVGDSLRPAAAGETGTGVAPGENGVPDNDTDGDADGETDLKRLFRILDILNVLLSKTKRSSDRDATLATFEDVIMEVLEWTALVLPKMCPGFQTFGPELRGQAIDALGKYCLLGKAAALRHRPILLKIAKCKDEATAVRMSAMKALSDLCLVFRSTLLGSTGDVLGMFTEVLRDESGDPRMTAVAAEVVARLLFFELAQDPELLARLIVLYFQKGSAADPAFTFVEEGAEGSDEEEEEESSRDAKAVGGSVRLSQILSVYFCTLPLARSKVGEMLATCLPHVLELLRDIAKRNKAIEDVEVGGVEGAALIDVPANDVVKFVLQLLMKREEESDKRAETAAAAAKKPAAVETSPFTKEGGEVEEEVEEEDDKNEEAEVEKGSASASGVSKDATGYVALCITEELWKLSGTEGTSDLVMSLVKVLTSLPLPEDNQMTLKRLRKNVKRLRAQGDGALDTKVVRKIAAYAEVLAAADLTPYDGVDSDDSDDSDDIDHDDSGDDGEKGGDGRQASGAVTCETGDESGEEDEDDSGVQRCSVGSPRPSTRRPSKQGKVAGSTVDDALTVESRGGEIADGLDGDHGESDHDEDDDGDDEDDDDEDYEVEVPAKRVSPGKSNRNRHRASRAKANPLSEISNSPAVRDKGGKRARR